jgi:hypothetical protein
VTNVVSFEPLQRFVWYVVALRLIPNLGTPFPLYAFSFFDRMFPLLPPWCFLLSFIVLFVPSPRILSLHSVGYRFASVCKFAHLGMTPLSIFDCPLLVPLFNSLLINSLSLFVLHYPLYRSFLSHPYSVNGRCETLPSCLDPLATRPSYFLHPALLLLLADRF